MLAPFFFIIRHIRPRDVIGPRAKKAGTMIVRMTNVSSSTPKASANPNSCIPRNVPLIIEANVPAMMTPQLVMIPPVRTKAAPHAFDRAAAPLFFHDSDHQIDVVILADGDQNHEQEHRQLPPHTHERLAIEPHEDQLGDADGNQVTPEHREDQKQRDEQAAEQHQQHDKDPETGERRDAEEVALVDDPQVVNPRCDAHEAEFHAVPGRRRIVRERATAAAGAPRAARFPRKMDRSG